MLTDIFVLLVLMKCFYCKTSLTTYPVVNLLENSPLNTFVIELESPLTNNNETRKLILLNLNDFESKLFSLMNGSIYTMNVIDREEFVNKKYCLDSSYCKIELHILVNDGYGYWIIPIHIVDENDNKPFFRENTIELKFRENILNGYKIPFEGAKDLDEGPNSEIDYILDCSNDLTKTSINHCFSLFELIIVSRSLVNFDQLALKFNPSSSSSSSLNIQNEYKLKLYARNKNENKHEFVNHLNLNIQIEQKEKSLKFSLSKYEFVVLLNSSSVNSNPNLIGRVYAISNNSFERIYYKLLFSSNQSNENNAIEINSLTGELYLINESNLNDQMEFDVQGSILSSKNNLSKVLICKTKVKILFRYFNLLKKISFQFQKQKQKEIFQLNSSNSFFIDQTIKINEELFEIFINSTFYPFDQFILSLTNYLHLFSLSPFPSSSSSSINKYLLTTREHLTSTSIYVLNIGVKHKLSQQWLPNLTIELIVVDQWTSTTTTPYNDKITASESVSESEMTTMNMMTTTSVSLKLINKSAEFCLENQSYIVYNINNEKEKKKKKKKNKIGSLKVIKSHLIKINNNRTRNLTFNINQSEIIVDGCRLSIVELNNSLNKSFEYQLCSSLDDRCYNIKIKDEINLISTSTSTENKSKKLVFSMKSIELIMFILSMIFILITILLILLICRLKNIKICFKLKKNFFYGTNFRLNQIQQFSSSSTDRQKRVNSIVLEESASPSFESIRLKNTRNDPYIFNISDVLDQEPLPSTNMFVFPSTGQISSSSSSSLKYSLELERNQLTTTTTSVPPPPPPRTCSSSSFLQETKQLLEMISTNQTLDLSKLVSEV